MKRISQEIKQEALRLRVEERLGLDDIRRRTGLSIGTLSMLLREHPLNKMEVREKMSRSSLKNNPLRKYDPNPSRIAALVEGQVLSTARKGRIAEAAVAFRLVLLGYDVLQDMFEGNRVDFTVTRPGSGKYLRLQVKWARRGIQGRPFFVTRNGEHGKIRHISREHCDFAVGYDLETDTAFVFPIHVCEGVMSKSCDEQYAEAWYLLDA